MQRIAPRPATIPRTRLWAEFLGLYAGVPVAMVVCLGSYPLIVAFAAIITVALFLLAHTPGFSWRELARGPVLAHWPLIIGFAAGTVGVIFMLVQTVDPARLLELPRLRPGLWLMIMVFYPIFSALPQEIIFRALFFRRYGSLFSSPAVALVANAAAFSLAHLFYQNAVAMGLTLAGGLIFGFVYEWLGSFRLAVLLHAIAGQIIFTAGLGVYFYHGAVGHVP